MWQRPSPVFPTSLSKFVEYGVTPHGRRRPYWKLFFKERYA